MPVRAEAQPPGREPAAARYVALPASILPPQPAHVLALLWDANALGQGWEAKRSGQMLAPAAREFCCVALCDLSVLLYVCRFCKLHFDKPPVNGLL